MGMIDCCEKFSVGHAWIDADHRDLVSRLNRLFLAVMSGAEPEEQRQLLDALIASTASHFAREEELMLKMSYVGLEKHKAEHDILLDEVRELQVRFNSGSIALTESLFDYLSEWLNFHTVTTDKKLAEAVALAG